jgi:hypothetical protein
LATHYEIEINHRESGILNKREEMQPEPTRGDVNVGAHKWLAINIDLSVAFNMS